MLTAVDIMHTRDCWLHMSNNYSSEPTKHGSVVPVHRLGWGQWGLLGALSGDAGWGERQLLRGHAHRRHRPDRFGGSS